SRSLFPELVVAIPPRWQSVLAETPTTLWRIESKQIICELDPQPRRFRPTSQSPPGLSMEEEESSSPSPCALRLRDRTYLRKVAACAGNAGGSLPRRPSAGAWARHNGAPGGSWA